MVLRQYDYSATQRGLLNNLKVTCPLHPNLLVGQLYIISSSRSCM